jgi:predicted nucleotidyltransferase
MTMVSGKVSDGDFAAHVAGRLSGLTGVQAVTLGGSRAAGTHRADSDWDFAVYPGRRVGRRRLQRRRLAHRRWPPR